MREFRTDQHGRNSTYAMGCRCDQCRTAHNNYWTSRRRIADRPAQQDRYLDRPHTVRCNTTRCPNQADGPWRILTFMDEGYYCARCGARMQVIPDWPDDAA